jgi:6-phosphogluconolactonase (cycloisomerase 2 family)
LRTSPDQRFAYVSNRGHDSIAVVHVDVSPASGAVSLALVQVVSAHCKVPRDIAVEEERVLAPCTHRFHPACLRAWTRHQAQLHRGVCPTCPTCKCALT